MQSDRVHFERLSTTALDWLILEVRERARREVGFGSKMTAVELRAINEFLLRPARELVARLEASGLTVPPETPKQRRMSEREKKVAARRAAERAPLRVGHPDRVPDEPEAA